MFYMHKNLTLLVSTVYSELNQSRSILMCHSKFGLIIITVPRTSTPDITTGYDGHLQLLFPPESVKETNITIFEPAAGVMQ